jgi:uncharacterized protein YxjI
LEPKTPELVFSSREYTIEQPIAESMVIDTFNIKDRNGNLLATAKEKMSWELQFQIETPDGTRLGEMRKKALTLPLTFEIYDTQGLVAVVKRKIFSLDWWLEDISGAEIARINGDITGHNFTIQSPYKTEIAQVHKKWTSIRNSYNIEMLSEDLTPYIVIAYAVTMDYVIFKATKTILGLLRLLF